MVRDYEAVFITSADLNSEEQAELLDRVRGFVARFEGQICREYFWGRVNGLPDQKKDYGIYHLWYLSGDGAMLEELERQFGYSEQGSELKSLLKTGKVPQPNSKVLLS